MRLRLLFLFAPSLVRAVTNNLRSIVPGDEADNRELFLFRRCQRQSCAVSSHPYDEWLEQANTIPDPQVQTQIRSVILQARDDVDIGTFLSTVSVTNAGSLRRLVRKVRSAAATATDGSLEESRATLRELLKSTQDLLEIPAPLIQLLLNMLGVDLSSIVQNACDDQENPVSKLACYFIMIIVVYTIFVPILLSIMLVLCIPLLPLCVLWVLLNQNDERVKCHAEALQCQFDGFMHTSIPILLKMTTGQRLNAKELPTTP